MATCILLVEDDDAARLVLADVLQVAGYDTHVAATGQAAIWAMEEFEFDVVISDLRLPDIDGIEVVRRAVNRNLPPAVLLLTGYGTLDTAIAALRAGACDYLLKPCSSDVLLGGVERALRQRTAVMRQADTFESLARGVAHLQEQVAAMSPVEVHSLPSRAVAYSGQDNEILHIGRLHIGRVVYEAYYAYQPLHLTPTEHALLRCLAEANGDVVTYSEIVRHTHRYVVSDVEAQMLLKSHVRNIRRKTSVDLVANVRHIGYRLVEEPDHITEQGADLYDGA